MTTTEVSFPSPDGTFHLYGNLSLPPASASAPVPAILMVNGSGPIDRDGNIPSMGMKFHICARFAEHALRRPEGQAFAVLSYDKRGVGKSVKKGDNNLYYRAGVTDLVADAVEAVRYLAGHRRVDASRIVVLGHSEGAIVLPLVCREVAAAGLGPMFGAIFYCGFGDNLKDAMAMQRTNMLADVQKEEGLRGWVLRKVLTEEKVSKQYNDMMEKVNAEDKPDFISTHCGLNKQPAKWFREHMDYDVKASLEKDVTCHCLAISGCKDVQIHNEYCTPDKAAALAPLAKSIEVHRPANLTHALRSLDGPSSILNIKGDYARMGKLPLDPELLSITDSWCDRILFGE